MLHARPDYQNRIVDLAGEIPADEPVFLLRGQDVTAHYAVREWASHNRLMGGDPKLIEAAERHADLMLAWPKKKKAADLPPEKPAKPKKPHPEKILGITRENLERLYGGPLWQGYLVAPQLSLHDVLREAELRVRDEVEEDPSFKQIIPYTMFIYNGRSCDGPSLVFSYARGASGGESRLHAKRSLGVGGHIDEADLGSGFDSQVARHMCYRHAWARELDEEVKADYAVVAPGDIKGFINDDSEPVGSVHLGVLHLLHLNKPLVAPKENALADPGFASSRLVPLLRVHFEGWSRIVIDAFWGGAVG